MEDSNNKKEKENSEKDKKNSDKNEDIDEIQKTRQLLNLYNFQKQKNLIFIIYIIQLKNKILFL